MVAKLSVEVVSPERRVLREEDVDAVVAPGAEGEVGILPRHAPLLTSLTPGIVRIRRGSEETTMAVGGGFLQVTNNRVLILADTAEREEEVDEARAQAARERAQAALAEAIRRGEHTQVESARVALKRAMARLAVVGRRRVRGMPR